MLQEKKIQYFTYRLKCHKTFRVVIRGLHPTTDINDIKTALNELGHNVVNANNIISSRTKHFLPMFNVELLMQPNNKEIFEIKGLLYTKVNIEPPQCNAQIVKNMVILKAIVFGILNA